ncbi:hypothetical protein CVIRNUC_002411 [Coccomyxa viridis]|uniref:Uncharacterized protein n=1 Tax=Coccomyxa viridis TaxID=1274662 RepID=A0AAV1I009_9CHLO|nr:hypothetical protein CVIRNUC_002411 [Coccomyxa viridis]
MEGALPRQRKAYKITKQREKWSDDEHARFVEAIDRFGRDWAKIVAHIGTRTVAQVRSHAQKFFLKLEKAGKADVVPPPRPKKRAAKPYPVQSERSEERRKSKRFRGSSSVTSTLSDTQDGTAGPSLTPTASGARASPRSYQTTFPSSRPVRAARLTRAAMAKEMSSGDLEGDGSNIASAHESNNESSGGPSAADNSGLSKPELMPTKGNMQPAGTSAPDYTKLFTVVGNVFNSGGSDNEANHQQMVQQLEPSQRQASHPQQSTASSLITVTPDSHDAYDDTSNALQPRQVLS